MTTVAPALPRLSSPTLHCPDAAALAPFYAALTGGEVSFTSAGWAVVDGPNGRLDFQSVTDFTAPTWPGGASPVRMHLDFFVAELEAGVAHATALGAERCAEQPNAEHCIVLRDPSGHPFCLTTWDNIGSA